jgi:hypothetical protein
MGEYALDEMGNDIKIGTCECMYYIRYEDRNKVRPMRGNVNPNTDKNLFWRLPFPDEDHIQIGHYEDYNRGYGLFYDFEKEMKGCEEYPGNIQLHNDDLGIHVNMKCYHNQKLPEGSEDIKPFWNGKGWAFSLAFIKNTENGILFTVRCNGCGKMWSVEPEKVLPFIYDQELKNRLMRYVLEG